MAVNSYKVWCPSWGDSEAAAFTVLDFDPEEVLHSAAVPVCRGTIHVFGKLLYVPFYNLDSAAEAAGVCADYLHERHGGQGAEPLTWPAMFRVRSLDGQIADFEITQKFIVELHVRPMAAQPAES